MNFKQDYPRKMSAAPTNHNDDSVGGDEANDFGLGSSEIVRRLDNLWRSQAETAVSPLGSLIGTVVGRYSLERIIGRGAFGVVYKAYDPDLHRAVAIKIPRPDVLLDSERLARFESEVQACARLDHPGIVPLYEADLSRAVPYMASAYCPGPNLQQWMDEAGLPCEIDSAVALIEKIARAVQFAHEQGVVHRDLKPSNILLVPNEPDAQTLTTLNDFEPRLTDFGLAQMTHGLHESQSSLIIGTPLYMSPEQAESRSDDVGPASDVFGLGAILYHLLAGEAPFAASNYAAVLRRLRDEDPKPLSAWRKDVDADLETVCLKCLERNPEDRYSSAGSLDT
jgi:eukaryotic-like serine/threonine-protein kinase